MFGCLAEKGFGRSHVALRSEHEVYRLAGSIYRTVQINPFATNLQWSKRQGVVELFPCLSSPNRTCTSQRIRLSIEALLIAKATSA